MQRNTIYQRVTLTLYTKVFILTINLTFLNDEKKHEFIFIYLLTVIF